MFFKNISAFVRYLNTVYGIDLPPSQLWYCSYLNFAVHAIVYISNLLILNMTFERFYSIIRPHKAASFNTVKRSKFTIVFIVMFSFLFNIPHWFISGNMGKICLTNVISTNTLHGKFYYWLSEILYVILPFILLLIMNGVIIHTLRQRSNLNIGQGHSEGNARKDKHPERQIYTMLLLVTFGFLILTTPAKSLVFYMNSYSSNTPYYYAGLYLFYQIGEKTFYTNHGINFFLYVMSGQKFRHDLVILFKCNRQRITEDPFSSMNTVSSSNTKTEI